MAGLTNQLATALAAWGAGISGVVGASATPVSTIPGTPYITVNAPRVTITGGSWETVEYDFPFWYLLERTADEAVQQVQVNDALDLIVAAFRSGISLGGLAVSAEGHTADTDKFAKLGATEYQVIEFHVTVTVMQPETYTP